MTKSIIANEHTDKLGIKPRKRNRAKGKIKPVFEHVKPLYIVPPQPEVSEEIQKLIYGKAVEKRMRRMIRNLAQNISIENLLAWSTVERANVQTVDETIRDVD